MTPESAEWSLVWRIWRDRRSERELELGILSRHGSHMALYVLSSERHVRDFLNAEVPSANHLKGSHRRMGSWTDD
jgi:hypothetical protein